jgi:hypothetical protein
MTPARTPPCSQRVVRSLRNPDPDEEEDDRLTSITPDAVERQSAVNDLGEFLCAPRNLLTNHGWKYHPRRRAWVPPSP